MSNEGRSWTAIAAVIVVTLLTATSVAALTAVRHPQAAGRAAAAPSPASPSPESKPTPTPLPRAARIQLSAPSAKVVWALVDYQSLFVSTDGGNVWDKRRLPDNFGVGPSVSFISASEGWLLAPSPPVSQCAVQLADLWHTADGAKTWQEMGYRIDKTQCKSGIYFVDSTHGFVTAWDESHRPTVYRTVDGGDRWTFASVPDNPIFTTAPGGHTLHVSWMKAFGQTIYLEASGTQQKAGWPGDFIYTSRDGGATWTWKQKIASPDTFLVTESRWLQLAPDIAVSVNGGQAFGPLATNLKVSTPMEASFPDGEVGYVTTEGAVLRTADGGIHWAQITTPWAAPVVIQPSPSPSPISTPTSADLSAPSANVLWALVGDARLFFSSNRGQTWEERSVPSNGPATEIAFVDGTNGWVSTCTNTTTLLWRTTDGARSWQMVSSPFPPDQCLLGLSFVDGSQGYISERFDYSPPAIFTTPDGGVTWNGAPIDDNPPGFQPGQPGNTYSVQRITKVGKAYYMSATGTVAGVYGDYVYGSTDQGATWRYLLTTPARLDSLVFVTATRWLAIGNDGKGQETTDAGKTWHGFTCDYSDAAGVASTFTFADANVGYGTVRGAIQVSTDGGLHWTRIRTPGT